LPRVALGRQKKYGIPFSPPQKTTFEREPQHRHKATLNQAIE